MIRVAALVMFALPLAATEPVNLAFEDQFNAKPELKSAKGRVVVLVYGDRKASDACRELGERLHLTFHPTAKGLPPAKARLEPAAAPPNLAPGKQAPGLLVQAVACCGKMPATLRPLFRTQIAKASPDVPVWLDFNETMVTHFGLTTGEANIAVFDAEGRFRNVHTGVRDADLPELVRTIQNLRTEASR